VCFENECERVHKEAMHFEETRTLDNGTLEGVSGSVSHYISEDDSHLEYTL